MTLTTSRGSDPSTRRRSGTPSGQRRAGDSSAARRSGAPTELSRMAERVSVRLDQLLTSEGEWWRTLDEDLVTPIRTLQRLTVGGGKRLRPAFCEWGFRAAGGDVDDAEAMDSVASVGLAFELLHAFALVHDDVMDESQLRRAEVTAHVEHADRHGAAGWRGGSHHYGESVAILIGDLAHVLASRAMADQPASVRTRWHELEVELMMGQYLDILGTARGDRSVEKAARIVQLKSGRYTIERPLRIGAEVAAAHLGTDGVDLAVVHALDGYGEPLGEAFQLRDDLLGAFGDPGVTGKPVGDDLREGKPTLLLALAVEAATETQARLLDRVGDPDLRRDDIEALQRVLIETGARARVEDRVSRRTVQAVDALRTPAIPRDVRTGLADLANFIAMREV